jgi:hypothetical protein
VSLSHRFAEIASLSTRPITIDLGGRRAMNDFSGSCGREDRMSGSTSRRPFKNRPLALLCILLALPLGAATARQLAPPLSTSPATGHAQVVTQGIADVSSEPMVWRLVERTAFPRWDARAGSRVTGFVMASDEPVLLTNVDDDGNLTDVARLAAGESFLVIGGTRQIRASMSDQPVIYLTLELVPAGTADEIGNGTLLFTTPAFDPGGGSRDIDLVRNALVIDDVATVPDSGGPMYILATDGAIDILPATGEAVRLAAGESGIFTGPLEITAVEATSSDAADSTLAGLTAPLKKQVDDSSGAGYVVAVIGVEIPPVQTPTAIPTEAPPTATAEAPVEDVTTDEPPIDQPVEEPTATATAEPAPNPDFDADGLPDSEERQYGTSPRIADSDSDKLLDGDEVYGYGTNPASRDTDGDALDDYAEIFTFGTDPTVVDTDGDQISDGREVAAGRDPLDPNA